MGSSKALRRLSDIICIENGLSVIENPKQNRVHYGEWLENNQSVEKPTVRENLERIIADALAKNPDSFEGFTKLLCDAGCEVKRGKYLSLKAPGYERWAKTFNLKQAVKTLLFLQESGLDELDKLSVAAQAAKDDYGNTQCRIDAINIRQKNISELQKHIGVYIKTKDVYAEYRRQKFSGKFKSENEKALADRKAAKAYFDALSLEKLPTMNMLKQEYAALAAEKKSLYAERNSKKSYMLEVLTAQQNVQRLLGYKDSEKEQGHKHGL